MKKNTHPPSFQSGSFFCFTKCKQKKSHPSFASKTVVGEASISPFPIHNPQKGPSVFVSGLKNDPGLTHAKRIRWVPRDSVYLGMVQWGSPCERLDAYYLSSDMNGLRWLLWRKCRTTGERRSVRQPDIIYAFGPKVGSSERDAGLRLLAVAYEYEREVGRLVEPFKYIDQEGMLKRKDFLAIAKRVWP